MRWSGRRGSGLAGKLPYDGSERCSFPSQTQWQLRTAFQIPLLAISYGSKLCLSLLTGRPCKVHLHIGWWLRHIGNKGTVANILRVELESNDPVILNESIC